MNDLLTLWKFLHVASAIVWLGAGVFEQYATGRLLGAGDEAALAWVDTGAEAGTRYYAPAAVSTLVFGVLTVLAGPWSFATAWIGIGFGGILVSIVLGAVMLGRTAEALATSIRDHGVRASATQSLVSRLRTISRVEMVVLFAVVWAMVAKPGA